MSCKNLKIWITVFLFPVHTRKHGIYILDVLKASSFSWLIVSLPTMNCSSLNLQTVLHWKLHLVCSVLFSLYTYFVNLRCFLPLFNVPFASKPSMTCNHLSKWNKLGLQEKTRNRCLYCSSLGCPWVFQDIWMLFRTYSLCISKGSTIIQLNFQKYKCGNAVNRIEMS